MFSKSMFIIHLYLQLSPVWGSMAGTHLLVTHVGPCDDGPAQGLLMTFDELAITTQAYDSSLSGEFNLTQDLENGWKVKGTMQKCQDIRNVETCDFLKQSHVVTSGCAEDNEAGAETYGLLFHYVDPELKCPIRAGVYQLTNYPLFTEDNFLTVYETKISTSVFGYTFKLEGFTADGQDKIFCMEAYLQLLYMREHDWLPSSPRPLNQTKTNE